MNSFLDSFEADQGDTLLMLLKDQYGNYVAQQLLEVSLALTRLDAASTSVLVGSTGVKQLVCVCVCVCVAAMSSLPDIN